MVHPLSQLAWSSSEGVPVPEEHLRELGQVRRAFAERADAEAGPSLLSFPGPGVVNSAARAMALPADWPRVRTLALALATGDDDGRTPVVASRDAATGHWVVAASSLERVIAHALADRLVAVQPGTEEGARLDRRRCFALHRRATRPGTLEASGHRPADGWRSEAGAAGSDAALHTLDAAHIVSSRDLEPVLWPKAFHLSRKCAAMDERERARTLGDVPVRWVHEVGYWSAGNRHRLAAARLDGVALAATPASGSAVPLPEL